MPNKPFDAAHLWVIPSDSTEYFEVPVYTAPEVTETMSDAVAA